MVSCLQVGSHIRKKILLLKIIKKFEIFERPNIPIIYGAQITVSAGFLGWIPRLALQNRILLTRFFETDGFRLYLTNGLLDIRLKGLYQLHNIGYSQLPQTKVQSPQIAATRWPIDITETADNAINDIDCGSIRLKPRIKITDSR